MDVDIHMWQYCEVASLVERTGPQAVLSLTCASTHTHTTLPLVTKMIKTRVFRNNKHVLSFDA